MKSVFAAPGDYIYFKSQVPLHKIPIGTKQWRYYDFGPKVVPPLICLPGTAGTADFYYKQIMSLSMKFLEESSGSKKRLGFKFRKVPGCYRCSSYTSVWYIPWGFLAQLFAQHRPRRVKSLILSNTFLETRTFATAMPWAPIVGWAPSFLLKRYVLTGIRDGPHEPFIADSVDFVVSQVETLSRDDLASRLTLTVDNAAVKPLLISDSYITIMDTNDYSSIPLELKDQLSERYPGARRAYLKTGGDFPFLSRPDEVNLHLQLHLRRVGLEAHPELMQSIPKDGTGGSHSKENDKKDPDRDDKPKDNGGNPESNSEESQSSPSAPEGSEFHGLDYQLLCTHSAMLMMNQHTAATCILLRSTWELLIVSLLPFCVGSLYISSNHAWKFRQLV
ncbi:Alpha/beta-Hydrolases superfamily protein isoform 2 [Hibiscus syriacus]|uniref:Alpha/beta-Hydrolases superfamily protein isoform 2 n=1 Tax=Hibiscus syriacus TaxID=106335 RepID=A0A6A3C3M6_HIBSY|nr:Alpha/beta-Hydrolases superfamily protein isoform 2 [Hibiscus syriacus]